MPAVSAAQERLMQGVAHSPEFAAKVGIPQSVGREFTKDEGIAPQLAAGTIFVAPDGAVLLLCRSAQEANYGGHWALPGGKGEEGETPWMIACREAEEEIGSANRHAWIGEPTIVDEVPTPNGMVFTTFLQPVRYRFVPEIDGEHCGYVWVTADTLPSPMHPQVARVLETLFAEGAEAMEVVEGASDSLALDRASVRSKDADGHLRVEVTPISKANICPYFGREIPGWQGLGLESERVYNLYRDPEELAKGAETFAGKPVLIIHKGVKAEQHPREIVVGAVGDGVVFDPPYLKAPLTIWDGEAIGLIESGEQRELSSSYRYRPDMTPGTGPDGQRFDGVMRDIQANHVALVEKGRAGADVLVQDNMPAGLAATNPNGGTPAGGAKRAPAHDDKETEMSKAKDGRASDEGLMERLKEKLSAEDYKALDEMLTAGKANDEEKDEADKKASDETAAEKRDNESEGERLKAREAREKAEDEDDDDDKADDENVSKEAMDAAIKSSVSSAVADERKHQAAIREAERFVRPWVGDLAVAFDSAGDVYKAAIEANGRSVKDVHPSAYRTILEMIPKPGAQRQQPTRLAMDGAKSNGFAERFPETGRIGVSLR